MKERWKDMQQAEQWKWKSFSCVQHFANPMDYTVHGTLQAKILEWVAFPFSKGSSQPRDQTQVSCTARGFLTSWATREAQQYWSGYPIPSPGELPDPGIEPESLALQADSLPTELSKKLCRRLLWFKLKGLEKVLYTYWHCFTTFWKLFFFNLRTYSFLRKIMYNLRSS